LSYSTTEKSLRKEFEIYGEIKKLKIVRDLEEKSRGYAFIEYENKQDCKSIFNLKNLKMLIKKQIKGESTEEE
jgi:U1 small nuclear ribonucleoprotein